MTTRTKDPKEPGLYKIEGIRGTSYEIVWRADGKQHRRRASTKREAIAQKQRSRVDAERGTPTVSRRGRTIAEEYGEWIAEVIASPRTIDLWKLQFEQRILPTLGSVRVSNLRKRHILDARATWIRESAERRPGVQGAGYRSANISLTALRKLLDWSIDCERLAVNVARSVPQLDEVKKRAPTAYEWEQVQRIIDSVQSPRDAALVKFLALSGLRIGEACALRWMDVQPDGVMVRHSVNKRGELGPPKKNNQRFVRLTPTARTVLDDLVPPRSRRAVMERFVFETRTGGAITLDNWRSRVWKPAVAEAGIPRAVPHELRHTFASEAISANVNVLALSRALGHAHPSVTLDIYAHEFDKRGDTAWAALDAAHERYAASE